ncbi:MULTISPECIES: hypothetical protein [Pseudomonas syringae group]|uniref:Uncharacterized protein n=1 Tax=Pseudomonas cannabina TaxID=86840 RepID=A0A3M3KEL5_PSECA|nr:MULTISPECIES: hypothetical protein [Pseudomonas syringae group]MDH4602415.1 hypothetical protein [Pseudomonas syringae pv. papulans]RMN21123.1 hypothetical protein ALQ64_02812 [Pseudomonas cannabina]
MDTPKTKATAIEKLRAAMTPVRRAYTHAARIDSLKRVQGMLFMLWTIEWVDKEMADALNLEILNADSEGMRRCEAKLAKGSKSRCMADEVMIDRARELMELHESAFEMRRATDLKALELHAFNIESRLMQAWPALIDDEDLIDWRIEIIDARKVRTRELQV